DASVSVGVDAAFGNVFYGTLDARGTADSVITFTSAAPTPAPGDWHNLYFLASGDDTTSVLDHCVIEYGGRSLGTSVYAYQASPRLTNSVVRWSAAQGVTLNLSPGA